MSQKLPELIRVGRTPPSATDPLVRLSIRDQQKPTRASAAVHGHRPTLANV